MGDCCKCCSNRFLAVKTYYDESISFDKSLDILFSEVSCHLLKCYSSVCKFGIAGKGTVSSKDRILSYYRFTFASSK